VAAVTPPSTSASTRYLAAQVGGGAEGDAVQVVETWMAGRRALMVGDLLDFCEHYAGLGPGTIYRDVLQCVSTATEI